MLSRTLAVLVTLFAVASVRAQEPKPKALPEFVVQKHPVSTVAFSPDGTRLAVAGGQSASPAFKKPAAAELVVWDLQARKRLTTFAGHKGWVDAVAFSPDGKTIASSSHDQTVRLWDVATGKEVAVLEDARWIRSLTFSPDGVTLAGSVWPPEGAEGRDDDQAAGTVLLWDVKERKVRAKLGGHAGVVHQVAFSRDGKTLAASSGLWDPKATEFRGWYKHAEIRLWDPTTGKAKVTLTAQKHARINSLVFSPDGKTFATGAMVWFGKELDKSRGEVQMWDVATGRVTATAELRSWVDAVAYSHDRKYLAVGSSLWEKNDYSGEVFLLDPKTLKTVTKAGGYDGRLRSLAFGPKQRLLAVPDAEKVKLWEIPERP